MSKGRVALITGAVLFAAAGIVARYVVLPSETVLKSDHVYAVDHKTIMATTAPAGSGAEDAKGLPLGFAFAPEKKNYDYWDSTTLKASPAVYSGTDKRGDRTVYVYKVENKGPVADPG